MIKLSPIRSTLLLACMLAAANSFTADTSSQPDLEASTDSGVSIQVFSQLSPFQINQMHSWTIRLLDSDNSPLTGASIEVTGGMPDHDHGLPTQPQITDEVDEGVYLLEGVRFHMQGRWEITITVRSGGEESQALIEFQLQ